MEWNKDEEWPVPQSKVELKKIANMDLNWLDCPDPNLQDSSATTQLQTDSDDFSIPFFW